MEHGSETFTDLVTKCLPAGSSVEAYAVRLGMSAKTLYRLRSGATIRVNMATLKKLGKMRLHGRVVGHARVSRALARSREFYASLLSRA